MKFDFEVIKAFSYMASWFVGHDPDSSMFSMKNRRLKEI